MSRSATALLAAAARGRHRHRRAFRLAGRRLHVPRRCGPFRASTAPRRCAQFGGLQWRVQTGGMVQSSAALHDGTLYIGSGDGQLYALDARHRARSGGSSATGRAISSTPAVADGLVFVGSRDNTFWAVDARTGRSAGGSRPVATCRFPWGFESGDLYTSSPTWADGTLYFGSGDGQVYAVDAEERRGALALRHPGPGARPRPRSRRDGCTSAARTARCTRSTRGAGASSGASTPRDTGWSRASSASTAAPSSPRPRWRTAGSSSARATASSTRWTPPPGSRPGGWITRCRGSTLRRRWPTGSCIAGSSDERFLQAVDAGTGRSCGGSRPSARCGPRLLSRAIWSTWATARERSTPWTAPAAASAGGTRPGAGSSPHP